MPWVLAVGGGLVDTELGSDDGCQSSVIRLGLILALVAVMAVGCFGGGSSAPSADLRVEVGSGTPPCQAASSRCAQVMQIDRSYSLTCDPTGGTMPNPQEACAAIAALTTRHRIGRTCIGDAGERLDAPVAIVSGTFAGKPYRLQLDSRQSWCGQPAPVLRDYWILSTFPCDTVVDHLDNSGEGYAAWAHKSGCTPRQLTIDRQG
jgi:hypothetical protein